MASEMAVSDGFSTNSIGRFDLVGNFKVVGNPFQIADVFPTIAFPTRFRRFSDNSNAWVNGWKIVGTDRRKHVGDTFRRFPNQNCCPLLHRNFVTNRLVSTFDGLPTE
ncbi:unnamed protein product [Arabidopsis halleri]